MSFGNFILHGVNEAQKAHLRVKFPKEERMIVNSSGGYLGNTQIVEAEKGQKAAIIDGVVKVVTVSDEIRKNERSFWNQHYTHSMITFTVTLIGGIAAAIAAVTAVVLVPPLWTVAVAVGVLALGVLSFSFFMLYRSMQAKEQNGKWKDPLPNLIHQRQQVGQQGFLYAYHNDLKGSLVAKEEMQDLWYKKMNQYQTDFSTLISDLTKVHSRQIRDFMNNSVLDREKLTYAFGDGVPAYLLNLSEDFVAIHNQYTNLREITKGRKRKINHEKHCRLEENNRYRDEQLCSWQLWFDKQRMCVENGRARVVVQLEGGRRQLPCVRRPMVRRRQVAGHDRGRHEAKIGDYDPRLEKMKLIYQAMTAPIRQLHSRNARIIKCWASQELAKIQDAEDKQLQFFLGPIKGLLQQYKEGPSVAVPVDRIYHELNFNVIPSAPPLVEEYVPPPFNPEWKEVVGKGIWDDHVSKIKEKKYVYRESLG